MNAFVKERVSKKKPIHLFPTSADSPPDLTHLSKLPTIYRAGVPISMLRNNLEILHSGMYEPYLKLDKSSMTQR